MLGRCICIAIVLSLASVNHALADGARGISQAVSEIAALEPELEGLYRDLHEHPELAFHEERTAAALAERLRALGFEVTTVPCILRADHRQSLQMPGIARPFSA